MPMERGEILVDDRDDKENMVSSSPDSGLCDLDAKSLQEVEDIPPKEQTRQHTLDPFMYNRKLTLLKSLSQDSEYSLDTSLFDAEEFLQDMGFAGTADPTIPDRFLPSLMQRLSRFPESEMESLHDRIIQSIGCFKRKEGKRRLFRNLSMGKDSRVEQLNRKFLGTPNNYPLLRSNTDPTAFPYEEATSSETSNSLQSRLSSNDSCIHSLGSSKDECELPESPIAILVSAASLDQEEKDSQQDELKNESSSETVASVADTLLQDDSECFQSTLTQISDVEFISTVEEIQKLTDQISDDDGDVTQTQDSCETKMDQTFQEISINEENSSYEKERKGYKALVNEDNFYTNKSECTNTKLNCNDITYNKASSPDENMPSAPHSDIKLSDFSSGETPTTKHPLRRISNAQSYALKNTVVDSSKNKISSTEGIDTASQYSSDSDDSPQNFEVPEIDLDPVSDTDGELLNNPADPKWNPASNSPISSESMPHNRGHAFNKPKYSRDDSLTNFLSSMLDTNDDISVLKRSVTPQNSISETKCQSDSEIPGSFASAPFVVRCAYDRRNRVDTKEISKNIPILEAFIPIKSTKAMDVAEKAPNRKRRVLRRMSLSLQCCDDVNCSDPDGLNAVPSINDTQHSAASPFSDIHQRQKITLRNTKSTPYVSDHRVIHPCNSLPAINLCGVCKSQCESFEYKNNVFACPKQEVGIQHNNYLGDGRNSYYRKKEKRICKRKRNLSCPSPEMNLNYSPWFHHRDSSQNFNRSKCDCTIRKCQPLFSESNVRSESYDLSGNLLHKESQPIFNFGNRNTKCRHSLQKECFVVPPKKGFQFSRIANNFSSVYFHSPGTLRPSSQTKTDSLCFRTNFENHYLCNSTPDLRYDCNTQSSNQFEQHCTDFSYKPISKYNSQTLFQDKNYLADDVFIPESPRCCCSFHYDHNVDEVKQVVHKSPLVRTPQRQNSISIEDSEVPFHNWTASNDTYFSNSNSPRSEALVTNSLPKSLPSVKSSVIKSKINDISPSINVPKSLQKGDVHPKEFLFTPILPEDKTSTAAESKPKTGDIVQTPHPTSPNNKSEALLERKIRIFSKFLANLGNLSKSIPDTDTDNRHKGTRDAKFRDIAVSDKRTKPRVRKVSCPFPLMKCSTPPSEFDGLLHLLKSMDSNENSGHVLTSAKKSESLEIDKMDSPNNEYPVYENRVLLQANCDDEELQQRSFKPVLFTSSVSLYINGDEDEKDHLNRMESKEAHPEVHQKLSESLSKRDELARLPSPQMSFKGVSKELEDLQLSIQKAKEMRVSASKELHLLQELLAIDGSEGDHETPKEKKLSTTSANRKSKEESHRDTFMRKNQYSPPSSYGSSTSEKSPSLSARACIYSSALTSLREKSKKEVLEDTSFWQEEIKRVRDETNQAWQEKLDRMEARLVSQEDELHRLQSDNESLQKHLESRTLGSPTCHCRSDSAQNGFGRIDSAFEDDEEYLNHKSSIPIQSTRQECDRLQERLMEEEQRADQLNLLLNQKLIEQNKLQITLSKQTKEMIELEKSYLQLQCRLRKGTSKPVVERLCSRTSPFSSKNLCPKPSPPVSPHPTNNISQ